MYIVHFWPNVSLSAFNPLVVLSGFLLCCLYNSSNNKGMQFSFKPSVGRSVKGYVNPKHAIFGDLIVI